MKERVRIVGDHPHRGMTGTVLSGDVVDVAGLGMVVVKLDPGTHAEECYAESRDLRPLPKSEDPDA